MKPFVRRSILAIGAVSGLSYGGMVVYLLANEPKMVFQPTSYGGRDQIPIADSLGLAIEARRIGSTPGVGLAAWIIRSADSTGPWLLTCHGNAGNITLLKRQRFYADAVRHGINVVAFDYRGFGASSDSAPTERGLYEDAQSVYRYLRDTLHVGPERIVIYGHSLGGGVATELATTVAAAGLILEGTFRSVPSVAKGRYPYLPIETLAENRFDNEAKIGRLRIPLLVMHARGDRTIPFAHGEQLFRVAQGPKSFVSLGGDHDSAWELDRDTYMTAFVDFIRRTTRSKP